MRHWSANGSSFRALDYFLIGGGALIPPSPLAAERDAAWSGRCNTSQGAKFNQENPENVVCAAALHRCRQDPDRNLGQAVQSPHANARMAR